MFNAEIVKELEDLYKQSGDHTWDMSLEKLKEVSCQNRSQFLSAESPPAAKSLARC